MPAENLPDWEKVLSAVARGLSTEEELSSILSKLESVAGCKTARDDCLVQIPGSLDGIDTGIRRLVRERPLETLTIEVGGHKVITPTKEEILRLKAVLILKLNAARDYIDFITLAGSIGEQRTVEALRGFDELYPQENGQSALMQLQIQFSNPLPFDIGSINPKEYKNHDDRWHDWQTVVERCKETAIMIFDRILIGDGEPRCRPECKS